MTVFRLPGRGRSADGRAAVPSASSCVLLAAPGLANLCLLSAVDFQQGLCVAAVPSSADRGERAQYRTMLNFEENAYNFAKRYVK